MYHENTHQAATAPLAYADFIAAFIFVVEDNDVMNENGALPVVRALIPLFPPDDVQK